MSDYFQFPLSGTEPPLSEMERAVQDNVHRYAVEVMRPLGPVLDRCRPTPYPPEIRRSGAPWPRPPTLDFPSWP